LDLVETLHRRIRNRRNTILTDTTFICFASRIAPKQDIATITTKLLLKPVLCGYVRRRLVGKCANFHDFKQIIQKACFFFFNFIYENVINILYHIIPYCMLSCSPGAAGRTIQFMKSLRRMASC
jgi:hypothetical protein